MMIILPEIGGWLQPDFPYPGNSTKHIQFNGLRLNMRAPPQPRELIDQLLGFEQLHRQTQ